ncbi:hypothetical protein D3C80_1731650 [compost metagenome]
MPTLILLKSKPIKGSPAVAYGKMLRLGLIGVVNSTVGWFSASTVILKLNCSSSELCLISSFEVTRYSGGLLVPTSR